MALPVCVEADLYPVDKTDRERIADMIDANLGDGSRFFETYRICADGVGPTTATLPAGWERRLFLIRNPNTRGAAGWCLEVHDIPIAKYGAGRQNDLRYLADLWKAGYVKGQTLRERLDRTDVEGVHRHRMLSTIQAHERQHRPSRGSSV